MLHHNLWTEADTVSIVISLPTSTVSSDLFLRWMKLSSALPWTAGKACQSPDVIGSLLENLPSSSLAEKMPAGVIQLLQEMGSRLFTVCLQVSAYLSTAAEMMLRQKGRCCNRCILTGQCDTGCFCMPAWHRFVDPLHASGTQSKSF